MSTHFVFTAQAREIDPSSHKALQPEAVICELRGAALASSLAEFAARRDDLGVPSRNDINDVLLARVLLATQYAGDEVSEASDDESDLDDEFVCIGSQQPRHRFTPSTYFV